MSVKLSKKKTNTSRLVAYTYPQICPRSSRYSVTVNGRPVFVYHTAVADFAVISFRGIAAVAVAVKDPPEKYRIRPLSRKIPFKIKGAHITFNLTSPVNVSLDDGTGIPLFFFANPLESDVPLPDDPDVLFFKGGQVYEVGDMVLRSGQRLYIQGGAVVRGCIQVMDAHDVRIGGRGVFDGGYYKATGERRRSIKFETCSNITVEDIVMIEPSTWMLVFGDCDNVTVQNLKQIGEVATSDGIDICGSRNVYVTGCFLRNNDDCVAIKAVDRTDIPHFALRSWCKNVEDVLVEECVFINDRCGNAMEVGHELQADSVRDITFRHCDVLSVHGHGAVFSIHNADHALVSNVLYEDIRIEHCFDKLIDFRVMKSRFGKDKQHGNVRNVTLKNIKWSTTPANKGYTISLISGLDKDHTVRNVTINNFLVDNKKATRLEDLDLHLRHISSVKFI